MKLPPWLGSKLIIFILFLCLIGLAYVEFKQYRKRAAIQKEIAALAAQQRELEGKNQDITESLQLLNDPAYREKLARQQLSLKKEGEIVVNFPSRVAGPAASSTAPVVESNPKKWWRYFFYKTK